MLSYCWVPVEAQAPGTVSSNTTGRRPWASSPPCSLPGLLCYHTVMGGGERFGDSCYSPSRAEVYALPHWPLIAWWVVATVFSVGFNWSWVFHVWKFSIFLVIRLERTGFWWSYFLSAPAVISRFLAPLAPSLECMRHKENPGNPPPYYSLGLKVSN